MAMQRSEWRLGLGGGLGPGQKDRDGRHPWEWHIVRVVFGAPCSLACDEGIEPCAFVGPDRDIKFPRDYFAESGFGSIGSEGVCFPRPAMVGASDERELERLEKQVEGGGGGVVEYLSLVRKLKVRRSNIVATHGLQLLNQASARSKLGSDLWTVYEQVAIACMDCHALDAAKKCINALDSKFPESMRVGRLEGMWYEAKGSWQKAEKVYSNLLAENPSDTVAHKRRIAMAKAQGNMTVAVEGLNKYLETFMADYDAWRELADIYTSLQMYKQAAFCFEELILAQPTNALYHLGYAEVLYTMGGVDNMRIARKYYASAIELSGGQNMRALYGMCLCGAAINQTKGRGRTEEESQELVSLATSVIVKEYKDKASSKAGLVSSVLDKYKQQAVA